MKDGVIADFEITAAMLKYFIDSAHDRKKFVRPRIIIGIRRGSPNEKRRQAAESEKAREVYLIQQPMAAAIGAGLPITEPSGDMIVDIGGGTSDSRDLARRHLYSRSVRVAGDKMDEAIIQHVKRKQHLSIGERTAKLIKMGIGTAYPTEESTICTSRTRPRRRVPRSSPSPRSEIREAKVSNTKLKFKGVTQQQ